MSSLQEQFKAVFNRFSTGQKISIITITAVTIFATLFLLIIVNRPQYTILFSDLSSMDASAVRDRLQDEKVAYRLKDGGTTILVPKDKVYDLRLLLVSDGIPTQAGVGYEIFDRTNLGMSDFVQKLNYKRALEGELSRTISSIAEVEQARVHVVIPEPSLFREDEKETTASVVLKLRSRIRLHEDQIRGISILVARSVEGLESENVTILDSYGNLLTGGEMPDSNVGLSATQLELQHNVESYLAAKTQTMLDGVLGSGRSIVRVNSELDFQSIERTSEIYDPESAVVRSEERTETESTGTNAPQTKEENSLSNYEINKTVEHLVNNGGSIIRLSVAVMIDGHYVVGEDGNAVYSPRSVEEMNSLSNMVRGALGLRNDRGDVLEITNIAFDRETFAQSEDQWQTGEFKDLALVLVPKIILGVVLVLLLVMVRGFLRRHLSATQEALENGSAEQLSGLNTSQQQLMPGVTDRKKGVPLKALLHDMEDDVAPEVREAQAKRDQVTEFAQNKPEVATMLLRSWILESGK